MWAEFWLAALVGVVFLYVPAYVVLRVLRFSRIASAACAPIITLLFYSLLAIIYEKLGIWTDGWMLFIPFCVIAIVAAIGNGVLAYRGVALSTCDEGSDDNSISRLWGQDSWLLLLYIIVGIAVGSYIFLGSLTTPDSTTYTYDDQSHLAYIRSFIERGNFSSIAANYEYDIVNNDGYYPAAWHLLSASISTICGVTSYTGANVALFLCCSFIYPLCCLFLIRTLFKSRIELQVIGAFLALVFASFPWEFVYYGRLVANLLAFCFVPAMLACTLKIFGFDMAKNLRVRYGVILLMSFALSLFSQPSVCFTWLFFSVPYLMHRIWYLPAKDGGIAGTQQRVLRVCLFCLGVILFLITCYMLPFLYALTRFKWPAPMSVSDAIVNVLLQGSPQGPYAFLLALLVFLGIVFALRKPDTRWIVLLWGILAIMYVVDAGTNLRLKNYMTGWWYTDSHRVMAMYSMGSYLLAVLGLGGLLQWVFSKMHLQKGAIAGTIIVSGIVAALAMTPIFWVGQTQVITPIGYLRAYISGGYRIDAPDDGSMFSGQERDFVQKAAQITGDDLVFNIPKDGSAFAYQSSGMKTYYRWADEGISSNAATRLVQRSLDDMTTNESVRRAVNELGVKYVMMLDQGHEPFHAMWGDYSDSNWKGVLDINEDTPGFELMLSDGDMKLYRILSEEEMTQQMQAQDQVQRAG